VRLGATRRNEAREERAILKLLDEGQFGWQVVLLGVQGLGLHRIARIRPLDKVDVPAAALANDAQNGEARDDGAAVDQLPVAPKHAIAWQCRSSFLTV
jgi:hypothetical protein